MRDLASCLSDHAVQVSDTSCSSYKNINPCIISAPSIQNSVTCLYKSTLKQMTLTLTWSRTASSHALTISFDDDPSATFKITSNSRLFLKSKGSKSLHLRSSSKIDLFWDLSTARYHPSPEPRDGFYLAVVVDSALGLLLGDKAAPHQFGASANNKLALVSRQEHLSGSAVYSTKARFSEGGGAHDVSIRCGGGGEMEQNPILWVCVDKKTVMKVRKVQWNFRGNQTIFVDGMLVDLLWDVHDWFYNPDSGCAVFMFKARSTGLDSTTFWMHDSPHHHHRHLDFSFMICACKNYFISHFASFLFFQRVYN